jgi:site-specific DNA-methyltransferase (adenine-specific)
VTSPTFKKVVIGDATLYLGEAADVLPHLSDIDSCVADGPYGLSFMGKAWDYDVPKADLWALIHAALKPGSHVVNFASARTYHRMAVEVENGGFEIRDQMMWLYGSGFPKSRDVSKDLDAKRGFKREVVGTVTCPGYADAAALHGAQTQNVREFAKLSSDPISDEAKHWEGWGTALKPAHEPIVLARKPLPTKRTPTYRNLIDHSVGALNIDGCRVASADDNPSIFRRKGSINHLSDPSASESEAEGKLVSRQSPEAYRAPRKGEELGRWPANVIHDGSDVVLSEFPNVRTGKGSKYQRGLNAIYSHRRIEEGAEVSANGGDDGSAARFFYCAKASTKEREFGLEVKPGERANKHPTVKPLALMKWLCKLITPPGGMILDPFLGSGSTGVAALQDGFRFIGIERDQKSFDIACARIAAAQRLKE